MARDQLEFWQSFNSSLIVHSSFNVAYFRFSLLCLLMRSTIKCLSSLFFLLLLKILRAFVKSLSYFFLFSFLLFFLPSVSAAAVFFLFFFFFASTSYDRCLHNRLQYNRKVRTQVKLFFRLKKARTMSFRVNTWMAKVTDVIDLFLYMHFMKTVLKSKIRYHRVGVFFSSLHFISMCVDSYSFIYIFLSYYFIYCKENRFSVFFSFFANVVVHWRYYCNWKELVVSVFFSLLPFTR